jgi:hypothetical protein
VEAVANSVLTPTEQKTVKSLLKSPEVQKEIDTDVEEGRRFRCRPRRRCG